MAGGEREAVPLLKGKSAVSASLAAGRDAQPPSWYAYFVTFAAAVSGFLFGYDIGIIDTVLKMPSFQLYFGTAVIDPSNPNEVIDTDIQSSVDGNVVSSFLAGCMGGSLVLSLLADSIGRKRSILVGAALFTTGGTLQAIATSLPFLYVARAVSGVSIGLLSSVTPLYLSEIAPAHGRGRMVAIQQLMITVGILVASVVNAVMYLIVSGEDQWRGALGAQSLPGGLLLLIVGWLPFSPRWLMSKGRVDDAVAVIAKLRGLDANHASVQAEVSEIQEEIDSEAAAGQSTWIELVRGTLRKRVLIACTLQFFQQWSGINFLLYFAADLFSRIGIAKEHSATTLVIVNAALLILGTLPGLWAVEVKGRRKLLLWGGVGMCLCHFLVCAFISISSLESSLSWAAVVAMFSFTFVFSATWGPVVWVVQSEILPLRARARGTAAATLTNWAMNAIIGKTTPLIADEIEQYTYAMFGCFCLIMTAYVYVSVPETMGVSLESMDLLFEKGAPAAWTTGGFLGSSDTSQAEGDASASAPASGHSGVIDTTAWVAKAAASRRLSRGASSAAVTLSLAEQEEGSYQQPAAAASSRTRAGNHATVESDPDTDHDDEDGVSDSLQRKKTQLLGVET